MSDAINALAAEAAAAYPGGAAYNYAAQDALNARILVVEEGGLAGAPEAATRLFLERFGEQAVLAVIPNTTAAEGRSPFAPTKEGLDFYRQNKATADKYPTVFGLFSPDGGEFDFAAYNLQMDRGDRVVITPDEAVKRANQRVAGMIYGQAKEIVGDKPTDAQRQGMRDLRTLLAEDFPGYSAALSNDLPAVLEDLKRAAKDPVLSKTDAGQGLQVWLKARDMAEQGAEAQFGTGWAKSNAAAPIREQMRLLAEELGRDFPGFTELYKRALEREMVRDA